MKHLFTGSAGLVVSEIVQQSDINDIAGAISQILIAIVTLIGIFNQNHKKNETQNPD